MKKEHSGDKERNRRDQVDVNILMMSTPKQLFVELFSPGVGISVFLTWCGNALTWCGRPFSLLIWCG
jgi:hypothetical protein